MSDRDNVINFTKGVLDRIRDHIKENFPESWKEVEETKGAIKGRVLKNGERVWRAEEDEEKKILP